MPSKFIPWAIAALAIALAVWLPWRTTTDAARAWERMLDSAYAEDSARSHTWARERDSLIAVAMDLRQDSATLDASRRFAQRAARRAQDSLRAIFGALPDSIHAQAGAILAVIAADAAACDAQLTNCELRAATAEARARGDSLALVRAHALLDLTDQARQDAERRARPNLLRDAWRTKQLWLPVALVSFAVGAAVSR